MGINGISWVGNIYQKIENLCLEVDEMTYGDTIEYIDNQVQNVRENFKKLYSDIMQDLAPPSPSYSDLGATSELPTDECTNETTVNISALQPTKDSVINNDVYENGLYAPSYNGYCRIDYSYSKQVAGSTIAESNLDVEATEKHEIPDLGTLVETSSLYTGPFAAEIKQGENLLDFGDEIENATAEEIPDVPMSVKWDEEKGIDMNSSSFPLLCDVLFDKWIPDTTETDALAEEGSETMQTENRLNLYNSCIMVSGDEVQLLTKAVDNQMSHKKKLLKALFLRKKSAREQEYVQLAVRHGNMAKGEGDCVENVILTTASVNRKQSMLPELCEADWELV